LEIFSLYFNQLNKGSRELTIQIKSFGNGVIIDNYIDNLASHGMWKDTEKNILYL